MKRDYLHNLRKWKKDPIRVPLLIRGARKVGKSWLVKMFGEEYSHYIEINFEKDRRVHALFPEHVDLNKTIESLQTYTQIPILPNKTLLFLDEIQECLNALQPL